LTDPLRRGMLHRRSFPPVEEVAMDAVLVLFLRVILPAAFFVGATVFIVREVISRRRDVVRQTAPVRPEPFEKKRTRHSLAPLFERLRAVGVEVWEQAAPPSKAPFRVVLLVGHESVYMCSCCGQRGKYAFGESYAVDLGRWGTVWLGHVCGHCGFVDRYASSAEARGFFSATLEHGGTLLDTVTALEAQGGMSLVERETVLMARGNVLRALREDIAARTGAAHAHPFRGWAGHAPFKA
jgi:hypothetical protein